MIGWLRDEYDGSETIYGFGTFLARGYANDSGRPSLETARYHRLEPGKICLWVKSAGR